MTEAKDNNSSLLHIQDFIHSERLKKFKIDTKLRQSFKGKVNNRQFFIGLCKDM